MVSKGWAARVGGRTAALAGVLAAVAATAVLVAILLTPEQTGSRTPMLAEIGGPFTLTNQEGRVVTNADFRGRWVLLYFGYTHCPDVCPTTINTMVGAIDALGPERAKIRALFITLDPERDTPAVLKDYTGAFQGEVLGLTGTPEQIASAAGAYRIGYHKHLIPEDNDYSIDHSAVIFLLDPAGRTVSVFSHETPPEQLAQRLKAALQ